MAELHRDQDFYMTLVTLRVQDRLFRVPRHTLEAQSVVFQDMFSFPPPPDAEVEGSSDERPIRLEGVTVDEFRSLLKVLYRGPTSPNLPPGVDEWISVLKLANMWQLEHIRTRALQNLEYKRVRKSAVEKVVLAFQYDVKQWITPGLNELARRQEPISMEDVELLGLDVALKVAAVRESLVFEPEQRSPYSSSGPTNRVTTGTRKAQNVDFTPTIKRIFKLSGDYPNGDDQREEQLTGRGTFGSLF